MTLVPTPDELRFCNETSHRRDRGRTRPPRFGLLINDIIHVCGVRHFDVQGAELIAGDHLGQRPSVVRLLEGDLLPTPIRRSLATSNLGVRLPTNSNPCAGHLSE